LGDKRGFAIGRFLFKAFGFDKRKGFFNRLGDNFVV